eukprot:2020968-Rhodomonas_salina.3
MPYALRCSTTHSSSYSNRSFSTCPIPIRFTDLSFSSGSDGQNSIPTEQRRVSHRKCASSLIHID